MFGETIKNARVEKGLSITALSRLSGVATVSISSIENERYMPGVATLFALARHIPIDINKLAIELEKEKNSRKGKKNFSCLVRFLEENNVTNTEYSQIICRSRHYINARINSTSLPFNTDDIKRTRDHFHLDPEQVVKFFLDDDLNTPNDEMEGKDNG